VRDLHWWVGGVGAETSVSTPNPPRPTEAAPVPQLKVCNRCGIMHPGSGPTCSACYRPRKRTYSAQQRAANALYGTAKWKRTRLLALDRDGHRCGNCAAASDLVVHHHREVRDGIDPFDLDNLETLCRRCHGRLHSRRRTHTGSPQWGGIDP
jgi:5-methylcytosine-specific restriction endonuclease McrA